MSQPGDVESANKQRQFSLAQLMACVFVACLVCGVGALLFDQSVDRSIKWLAAVLGLLATLAALTRVRIINIGECVTLLTIGLLLAVFLVPVIESVPGHRPRPPCTNNLHQIARAVIEYADRYHSLPPAYIADAQGRPIHSWRVLILPQLGEQALYDQYRFDESWDGPNNKKLQDTIVDVYRCPDDHPSRRSAAARDTSYVVIVGPGTAFPGGRKRISMADVVGDGASNTLLVAEVHSSGIHWMEPRDLNFAEMDFQINGKRGPSISSAHPDGVMAAMADGGVRFIEEKMRPEAVKKLIQVNDGTPTEEDL